jgi:hypothetical protein
MTPPTKKTLVPSLVAAFAIALILGTHEVVSLAILTATGFIPAMVVLAVFLRLAPLALWPPWKQRAAIWLVAALAAVAGCLLALAPAFLRRR